MSDVKKEQKSMLKILAKVRAEPPEKRSKILVSQNWKNHPNFRVKEQESISFIGLDCEMVSTEDDPNTLARVSIVDLEGNILLDELVIPEGKVKNLRTPITGIKKRHLKKAKPFSVVQASVRELIEGKIVVGHAIHNDFRALKLNVPQEFVKDTQQLYKKSKPHSKSISLKKLYFEVFKKEIQTRHHSSVEDARATVDIFKVKYLPKMKNLR